jgi:hypothetical protein
MGKSLKYALYLIILFLTGFPHWKDNVFTLLFIHLFEEPPMFPLQDFLRKQNIFYINLFVFLIVSFSIFMGMDLVHANYNQPTQTVISSGTPSSHPPIPRYGTAPTQSQVSQPYSKGQLHPHAFHQHHHLYKWFPKVFNLEEDLAMKYFHPLFEEDEEEDMTELSILPPPPSPPLPHSLIIEERCGTFITIDWPESGVLYENEELEPCP